MPTTLFCDVCGAANRPEARFCFSCGELLRGGVPAVPGMVESSPTGSPLLMPETSLRQRYRILSLLGQGGFGAVYKAEDSEFGNRLVAVKEMSQKGLNAQEISEATDAFKREALLLGGLVHPNLPRIYDHFNEAGRWYLVMDFIEGETLEERMYKVGLPFRVEDVLDLAIKLCTVLDYLHHRQPPIIFRDLKPANIMVSTEGNLYLIDFGIARHFKPGQARDTVAFGSPGYAAPEQYGQAQTTPRSDIYSLGAIMHQLLSGNDPSVTPFRFNPLSLGGQLVPAALDTLILRMVEIDESKRPAAMAAVKQELEYIATHPDDVQVASAVKNTVLWGTLVCAYQNQCSHITAGAWSPAGSHIVSASEEGVIKVWDADKGHTLVTYHGHASHISAVAWSPDGMSIATASKDRTAQVWHATTGQTLATFQGHACPVYAVAWSPRAKRIVSGGQNKAIYIWDAATGLPLGIYHGHTDYVYAVAWSPGGQYIASASADRTVRVWDANTGHTLTTYQGHRDYVYAVAWSPDGQYIASASEDKSAQVWNVSTGEDIYTCRDSSSQRIAVVWAADIPRSAFACSDGTVRVWDAVTGRNRDTYRSPTNRVVDLAWSPDGQRIASGSGDQVVEVWKAM